MTRLTSLLAALFVLCLALPALATGGPNVVDDYVDTDNKVSHIDVLANDVAGGASLDRDTLRIASNPSQGDAIVIASGSPRIKYTAFGTDPVVDTFTYEICDSDGLCAAATVTVNFAGEVLTTTTTTAPSTTTTTSSVASTTTSTDPTTSTTVATDTTSPDRVDPPAPAPVSQDPTPVVDSPAQPASPQTPIVADSPSSPTVALATTFTPKVHTLGEMTLGSQELLTAGATIGEARGIRLDEDVAYLGRSGLDTIALVATPALMVSGIIGFLMIGLPQNAIASVLGLIAGFRRRRDKDAASRVDGENLTP
jgi:hypothetical protein